MKTALIKTIICLSLVYCNFAIGGGTVHKCVDEKGAVTYSDRCASDQQATDTGVVIDSRSDEQKAADETNHKKYLSDLEKQSKITPTPTITPVAQPYPAGAESTTTDTSGDDDDSYECLSTTINCLDHNLSNLTPAQKLEALKRKKAAQLPARVKHR